MWYAARLYDYVFIRITTYDLRLFYILQAETPPLYKDTTHYELQAQKLNIHLYIKQFQDQSSREVWQHRDEEQQGKHTTEVRYNQYKYELVNCLYNGEKFSLPL
ncbi:uncharacterized protein LOC116433203 [Nomia melanderi]|uniref:uncharacterized protein LOC116433203 n=1 Tax=Nomia melanderi TaxID=2448451 RepID=UPI003FCC9396